MLNKDLIILIVCQLFGTSASVLMITIGGIIGSQLAPDKALATLPVTIIVLGTAVSTYPASMIMQRIGRRLGYALAAMVGCISLLVCGWSVQLNSFFVFCLGTFLFGFNVAFVMQYRFAAAESVSKEHVSKAISWVLVGSIGGAFLGPGLITHAAGFNSTPYVGSLFSMAALLALTTALLCLLTPLTQNTADSSDANSTRTIRELFLQRRFMLAVLAGVTAQGVMVLIMTATPISMHLHQGHSMDSTAMVIRSHVLAMYLPSLVSGYLISMFGLKRLMIMGCALFFATLLAGFWGQAVMHYWLTLVLLGVGWNFLYVGGTTLLTTSYKESEKFKAQGINDLLVFGGSACASLLAGTILHYFGWNSLLFFPLPLLLMMMFFATRTKLPISEKV